MTVPLPARPGTVRLDFPRPFGPGRGALFSDPVEIVAASRPDAVRPALAIVERAVAAGYYAAGFLSYEAAPAFDPALVVRGGQRLPLLWFGLYHRPEPVPPPPVPPLPTLLDWHPTVTRERYQTAIQQIHDAIARGETYQVNHTFRLRAPFAPDLAPAEAALYARLYLGQGTGYGAHMVLDERFRILSASPELFFHRRGDRVVTRPMKGTARRGRWLEEEHERARQLASSPKERAENVMIVDLLRNDLGRVAQVGSVHVPALFQIEKYPTILQMTSTVEATVPSTLSLDALLAALFPCGSVTGAPKVSTMRLIAALESTPREVYCGAIGFIAPDGEALFNVAIRTLWLDREAQQAEYGVGGGVVWDSTAEGEYDEALAKAALLAAATPPFDLLETIRLEEGEIYLLERHLDRLRDSATYFDRPYEDGVVRAALAEAAASNATGLQRLRLRLTADGRPLVTVQPLEPPTGEPLRVALAEEVVDSSDRMLFHKTTLRDPYRRRRERRPDCFDVLMQNERGELTEFTLGNLIVELDGRRWTPPLESGLLPGTLRADLLARGEIEERPLPVTVLEQATGLWFINSVRGRRAVRLVP